MLYIVGIGPGSAQGMTLEAQSAIAQSAIIVGYTVYNELLKPLFPGKEYVQTPMRREVDRVRAALELSRENVVALVCSGDCGVYGMAGLALQLAGEYPNVEIEIVPGVTAALSGGAVLGAPLTHDFAVISLSDLLTPWEKIEKRLSCAAEGDFTIVIYNPSSAKRADHLRRACDIILKFRSGETVCGWVKNIGRDGEDSGITTLSALRETTVDMFTTVFVGNSETRVINGKMVTPRGYRDV